MEAERRIEQNIKGSAEEREAAYAEILQMIRDKLAGGDEHDDATSRRSSLAESVVFAVKPLIADVLCADASRVGVKEWQRAALVLGEMCELHPPRILGAAHCKDTLNFFSIWTTPGTVFDQMVNKKDEFTPEDALTAACCVAMYPPMWTYGATRKMHTPR